MVQGSDDENGDEDDDDDDYDGDDCEPSPLLAKGDDFEYVRMKDGKRWGKHRNPCERCTGRGRICDGFEGEGCIPCLKISRAKCEWSTKGKAGARKRREEEERKNREARNRAVASLLEMPAEVALPEEVDIENLLSGQGKDDGEVLLAVAEQEIRLQLRLVAKMEGRLQSVLGHVSRAREQIAARSAVEDEGSGAKGKGKGEGEG